MTPTAAIPNASSTARQEPKRPGDRVDHSAPGVSHQPGCCGAKQRDPQTGCKTTQNHPTDCVKGIDAFRAVGLYNFVTGLYLAASLIAGLLWATSPALVFSLAAGLSVVAIALFVGLKPVRGASNPR